jgi:hypothetical protein
LPFSITLKCHLENPSAQSQSTEIITNIKTSIPPNSIYCNTNTMSSNEEINAAHLRGAITHNEADELLLDPDQRAQNQRDEALLPPPENTAAMAQLFLRHFGGDAQPPTADHTGPPINSRPRQHPSIASTQQ